MLEVRTELFSVSGQFRTTQSCQADNSYLKHLVGSINLAPRAHLTSEHSDVWRPDRAKGRERVVSSVEGGSQCTSKAQRLLLCQRTTKPASTRVSLTCHVEDADSGGGVGMRDQFRCCEAIAVPHGYFGPLLVALWCLDRR